jgi:thiol-disulfide isomerase/thioredoxin
MSMYRTAGCSSALLGLVLSGIVGVQSATAAAPTAEQALQLTPIQKDVSYEQPTAVEAKQATIKAEKISGTSGWVVRNASGQIVRMFTDSNSDNVVDRWSYYENGIEVYRDIDSNFNGKADQYRWFNTAGTRWGMDKDEDGRIDAWRIISAEEVCGEVVAAIQKRDAARFTCLLLTEKELEGAGLGEVQAKELARKLSAAEGHFRALMSQQKEISPESRFASFGGTKPGIVPAGTEGSTQDLMVYENVAAMVEKEGKHIQLFVGTLLRVGNVWRLIDVPVFQNGTELAGMGYFIRASHSSQPKVDQATGAPPQKLQQLMEDLEKLEQAISQAAPAQQETLNGKRADLLQQLADDAEDEEHRIQWTKQMVDTVSAAVQTGTYSGGVERLMAMEKQLDPKKDTSLLSYVKFRRMTASYALELQKPKADFAKVQEAWLVMLESFVKEYPESADSADAMLQLAMAQEFAGEEEKATDWYGQVKKRFPQSTSAKKAAGAVARLQSVGKPIEFNGTTVDGKTVNLAALKGKVVLIQYWATWCEPCIQDMERIGELHSKYAGRGFEVIGVNLDNNREEMVAFLSKNRLPWPQIHEAGGLDSRPANDLGILTLPTMMLIGKDGNVISRNLHVSELDVELKKQLQ